MPVRTHESSVPSLHFTRKSRVPFSFFLAFSTATGSTSSNKLSARQCHISEVRDKGRVIMNRMSSFLSCGLATLPSSSR